jgi:hypothetical protein
MGSGGHGRLLRAKLTWAAGVDLGPDIVDANMRNLDALGGNAYSSLHHDLTHGKRLEPV